VDRLEFARLLAPDFRAFEVVTDDEGLIDVEERDPNVLAVGRRRRTGVAVEGVFALELGGEHRFFPLFLPRLAVEAVKHPLLLILDAGCDEDALPGNDGRGMSLARDLDLPEDIFALAPADWDSSLVAGSIAARAAPTRPVRRDNR